MFFKSKDPNALKTWYRDKLGIESDQYGTKFMWRPAEAHENMRTTVWSPMSADTDYYAPSERDFMINYRVEHLEDLLAQLAAKGVNQVGEMQTYEYGKFAWVMDPDGTKIELWEPKDEHLFYEEPMIKSK